MQFYVMVKPIGTDDSKEILQKLKTDFPECTHDICHDVNLPESATQWSPIDFIIGFCNKEAKTHRSHQDISYQHDMLTDYFNKLKRPYIILDPDEYLELQDEHLVKIVLQEAGINNVFNTYWNAKQTNNITIRSIMAHTIAIYFFTNIMPINNTDD